MLKIIKIAVAVIRGNIVLGIGSPDDGGHQ